MTLFKKVWDLTEMSHMRLPLGGDINLSAEHTRCALHCAVWLLSAVLQFAYSYCALKVCTVFFMDVYTFYCVSMHWYISLRNGSGWKIHLFALCIYALTTS